MSDVFSLGLYKHDAHHPSVAKLERAYGFLLEVFSEFGVKPTYFHFAKDGSGAAKMYKWGSIAHRRQLQAGFSQICGISLVANPAKSNEPAYDSFFDINYSYLDYQAPEDSHYINWTEMFILVDKSVIPLDGDKLKGLIRKLVLLERWDFGFGLAAPREKGPELYLMGASNGRLNEEEERRLGLWDESPQREWMARIRDVFPHNLLNSKQLGFALSEGSTLRTFIENDASSSLCPVGHDLELWTVEAHMTEHVRSKLFGTGILITE